MSDKQREAKDKPLHEMMREPVTNFSRLEPTWWETKIDQLSLENIALRIERDRYREALECVSRIINKKDFTADSRLVWIREVTKEALPPCAILLY